MQVEQRVHAFARGGRLTKWKGKVASIAPSLFLSSASVLAVSAGATLGEVVNGPQTTPLISSVDEDHTITDTGSISINPLLGPALVQVNVADYSSTVTNAGQLTAPEANVRTHSAIDINGDLSGTVLNSGTITMGAALGDTAVIFGVDVSGVTTESVQNTGVIDIANSALTIGTSVGILTNQVDGTLANSGTISLRGSNSSRAEAIGLVVDVVNGTASNSGNIGVDVSSTGGQAIADGISLTTINGVVDNSGPINVSATGATIASADGFGIGDLVGDLNNVGAINVSATAGNNANGDAIEITNLTGRLTNAGPLTVTMTAGNTGGAFLDVVEVSNMTGSLTNTGFLVGVARGGNVIADGFDIGGAAAGARFDNSDIVIVQARATTSTASADGLEFGDVLGSVSNSGPVNAIAEGVTSATARGIRAGNVTGILLNRANILADALASNGSARAFGIQVDEVRDQLTNDGELVALANGSRNGAAIGISTGFVQGTLANNGAITAIGQGSSANATGIEAGNVDGSLINTNTITMEAVATSSSALVTGIDTGRLNGTLQNSGSLTVQVDAVDHASAYGIDVGEIYGALNNSGSISVNAINGSSIEAIGIRSSTVAGTLSNSGSITVAARGQYASAEGIRVGSILTDAEVNNSGTVSVLAESQTSQASANGILTRGLVSGNLRNSGSLVVQANSDVATASAYGIFASNIDSSGQLENSGSISAIAQGGTADARGIRVGTIDGKFQNSGAITVLAQGTSAIARGIETGAVNGSFDNSGTITVAVSGETTAAAAGILHRSFAPHTGSYTNSGNISVAVTAANGSSMTATGIASRFIDGTYTNSGNITVAAIGDRMNYAYAQGINTSRLDGQLSNSGDISVAVKNAHGSSAYAEGIFAGGIMNTAALTNSGTVHVSVDTQNMATAAAIGLGAGFIEGRVENSGAIIVSAQGDQQVRAHGLTTAGLASGGVLTHSGSILVSADGGADTEAYGIFVGSAQGTVNVTGDVSATSTGKSYAVFLGDGGGTLNVETTADIDGTIRVSDHDVNLSHVGGRVVYRFQDDDTANGVFTTSVSSASQGWFVDNEGGAAPVYASFDATEIQPNTNQSFEIAGLSYNLARQLDSAAPGNVSRDRVVLSTRGSGPIEGFRPYVLVSGSRSDGTASGSSTSLSSNMWSVSVGATRDLGTGLRYGFGASYFENDGTFGSSSFDTSGVFVSGVVAQNFGFADLSFGLGYGDLDTDESRPIGSDTSKADYSGDMITALIAAKREFTLKSGAILTPRASFLYGEQNLDGYTETGGSANATVGDRTVTFNETRIGGEYATYTLGGRLSASLEAVHRDADAPSAVDVTIFGNTLALASGGGGTDTFGEVGLNFEKSFDHGGILHLEARSTLGADVSTQSLWASYEWKF